MNGTTGFFDHGNIKLDTKNIILSALVQTLWSKTYHSKIVAKITCSSTYHVQTVQDIL